MPRKPHFSELRELQRQYLQLRWDAICARGDQSFYARSINTHVVSSALGHDVGADASGADSSAARHNLPSYADSAAPLITILNLFVDSATCGFRSRKRRFTDFGDGMLSIDAAEGALPFIEATGSHGIRHLYLRLHCSTRELLPRECQRLQGAQTVHCNFTHIRVDVSRPYLFLGVARSHRQLPATYSAALRQWGSAPPRIPLCRPHLCAWRDAHAAHFNGWAA